MESPTPRVAALSPTQLSKNPTSNHRVQSIDITYLRIADHSTLIKFNVHKSDESYENGNRLHENYKTH